MRRLFLGLVAVAALAACTDSNPTGARASGPNLRVRSVVATATLDEDIQEIIGFWPKGLANALLAQWTDIKKKLAAGKLDEAQKSLDNLGAFILKKTPDMNDPPGAETPEEAASRLVLDMVLYVYGGTSGGNNIAGVLTPDEPLTLVTPDGRAGVHFDEGSVNENRIIVVSENPTVYGPCDGPLLTELCQYAFFFNILSYPDGALLKTAEAAVCHIPVGDVGGPPDEATHDRLRLAHTKPDKAADYVEGGTIRDTPASEENIEILPLISPSFILDCGFGEELVGEGLLQRTIHLASALASRVGKLLTPRSAYAIDQGGGAFDDFSPFNNVDPGPPPCEFEC